MATGLMRDPVIILRIDGEDLLEFAHSPRFEPEMVFLFSEIDLPGGSLRDYIVKMFEKLTVEQGMPPSSDSWVMSNIVEPSLQSSDDNYDHKQPLSQETVLVEFRKVVESVAQHLKEHPVIVAHTENTLDGSAIKRLLSTELELDKSLDAAIQLLPKDHYGEISKEYLSAALESLAVSTSLPHCGTTSQIDKVVEEVVKEFIGADDGKLVKEAEFKKMMTELLGSIMVRLEDNPISVSSSSVVNEPLASSSTILAATSDEDDPGDNQKQ